jgi:hypothetical protein
MANNSPGGKSDSSLLSFVGVILFVFLLMAAMVWYVSSNKIVYYLTPIVDAIASPWRLIPSSLSGTINADLDVTYKLFRYHANRIGFLDWISYVNLAFKPLSIFLVGLMIYLFYRQTKVVAAKRLNDNLSPKELAIKMMTVFPDIAPVVAIQDKLVANSLPKWARQVFPEELIRRAKYQNKSVLVPNRETDQLMIDETRLIGHFNVKKYFIHQNTRLAISPYLGRQIVDIRQDSKNKTAVFPDRLSDSGKAIYSILAPHAFGGVKGKAESLRLSNALNMSAYRSAEGMCNLSIDVLSETFQKWRDHPISKKLAKMHHWENTFLYALLDQARSKGKIGTWSFIWLKPMNRILYYALNTEGRKTPHAEAGITFSQFQFERRAAKKGRIPVNAQGEHQIYSKKVVEALQEEWELWLAGGKDNDDWWKEEKLRDWQENSPLFSEIGSISTPPVVPEGVL